MDIYVHPGINKGCIQRKHIFLLRVGRKGHNEQTLIFSIVCGKTKGLFVMSFPTYPQKENVFSLYTSFINPRMNINVHRLSLKCHSSPTHKQ